MKKKPRDRLAYVFTEKKTNEPTMSALNVQKGRSLISRISKTAALDEQASALKGVFFCVDKTANGGGF